MMETSRREQAAVSKESRISIICFDQFQPTHEFSFSLWSLGAHGNKFALPSLSLHKHLNFDVFIVEKIFLILINRFNSSW